MPHRLLKHAWPCPALFPGGRRGGGAGRALPHRGPFFGQRPQHGVEQRTERAGEARGGGRVRAAHNLEHLKTGGQAGGMGPFSAMRARTILSTQRRKQGVGGIWVRARWIMRAGYGRGSNGQERVTLDQVRVATLESPVSRVDHHIAIRSGKRPTLNAQGAHQVRHRARVKRALHGGETGGGRGGKARGRRAW